MEIWVLFSFPAADSCYGFGRVGLQGALAWQEGRPAGLYWKPTMFRLRQEVEGEQVGHGGLFL